MSYPTNTLAELGLIRFYFEEVDSMASTGFSAARDADEVNLAGGEDHDGNLPTFSVA
jgi:hypothetical protein